MEGYDFGFNLNDVVVFVEVARHRNISRTAERTGVPASTLSRRLTMLEERLGVQLLSRSTRKIMLTEAGQLYYEHCEQLVKHVQQARDALLNHGASPSGTLKMRLPDSLDAVQFAVFMKRFADAWPDLRFQCVYSDEMPQEGEQGFDVALRWGAQPDSDFIARSLGSAAFGLYASPHYLNRRSSPRHPDDLAQHECLTVGASVDLSAWTLTRDERRVSVQPSGRLQVGDLDLAQRLACAGAGIAALPVSTARLAGLEPVLPGWQIPPVTLYALYGSRTPPARVRVFVDTLIEHVAALRLEKAPALSDKNDLFASRLGQPRLSTVEAWAA